MQVQQLFTSIYKGSNSPVVTYKFKGQFKTDRVQDSYEEQEF